jgi:hypothetical protein
MASYRLSEKADDAKRFNALAAQARSPAAAYTSEELVWYANAAETVIGVILLDTINDDYVAIVLGRDEGAGSEHLISKYLYRRWMSQLIGCLGRLCGIPVQVKRYFHKVM